MKRAYLCDSGHKKGFSFRVEFPKNGKGYFADTKRSLEHHQKKDGFIGQLA
ncbi:hypothetical protein [Thermoactinomyces mirandus]|uniref:Uncharacterized protein n=1 Tax=Thermoactinomyces mirandus TaxID=2756294 RepID=A0A7W2ARZ4_9BACL|nr:hypothetical protein [Thermoactinomyces mirandus]MBA4602917.1 hypothetical protein [Thermoactinomyces mirandus]